MTHYNEITAWDPPPAWWRDGKMRVHLLRPAAELPSAPRKFVGVKVVPNDSDAEPWLTKVERGQIVGTSHAARMVKARDDYEPLDVYPSRPMVDVPRPAVEERTNGQAGKHK